jgi:hypothetical protein
MKKRQYLALLLEIMTADEIKRSALSPTPYMTKMHILLHWLALRKMGV